jgi:hypothetical protein
MRLRADTGADIVVGKDDDLITITGGECCLSSRGGSRRAEMWAAVRVDVYRVGADDYRRVFGPSS